MNHYLSCIRLFLYMTLVTGIFYPLLITGIAQISPKKANGNFISRDGKIIGATLIGQKFQSPKYFWGRPSAVDYNPLPSGGSNLGWTSNALKKIIEERKVAISKAHELKDTSTIPSELLYASGSGLDPHISPPTALFQVDRIVKARGWDQNKGKEEVNKLIVRLTEPRALGILGTPVINVLKLNLALDELKL